MSRIGVFVCHCGENIARTVDVEAVAEAIKDHPGVAYATDYKYMCSDPGQTLIKQAIKEKKLTGVVVAACSPHMHEMTFRRACDQAGLNPYMCEMANIREHCSLDPRGPRRGHRQGDRHRRAPSSRRSSTTSRSRPIRIPVTKRALVIGGGIAGIQAALDIADGGHEVILVEKEASIGGHMASSARPSPPSTARSASSRRAWSRRTSTRTSS